MSKFIPVDRERAEAFVERLSNTLFRDPETFIEMFNTGLINRKNSEVVEISDELLTVFKGIERKGDKITFLDQGEIAVDDLFVKLEAYQIALQLKRIFANAVKNGELELHTEFYLDGKGNALDVSSEDNKSISKERIAKISNDGYAALAKILNLTEFGPEVIVRVENFVNIDASPVVNAAQVMYN